MKELCSFKDVIENRWDKHKKYHDLAAMYDADANRIKDSPSQGVVRVIPSVKTTLHDPGF